MIFTTDKIVALYNVLNNTKLTKMEDSDKFLIIKILKKIKPIVNNFDDYKKNATERLRPENLDEILMKYEQWQREGENTTLTEEEQKDINMTLISYDNSVNNCINEELDIEQEVDFKPLSEKAFEKLLASNDWDIKTSLFMAEMLLEDEEENGEEEVITEENTEE